MKVENGSGTQGVTNDNIHAVNGGQRYNWPLLLSTDRLPTPAREKQIYLTITDRRTEHERDFDRVAFCTPVRRMKDKTQVFPLDMHDGVRTRLTHSMEVSNLARSIGTAICAQCEAINSVENAERNIPALVGSISLVHDLGNPPFGHQGEIAIRNWIEENEGAIKQEAKKSFNRDLLKDFLLFEGNAQGFRVLTRLQHLDHKTGLRLTASTLRAFMKYPWMSDAVHPKNGKKKFGVFRSEQDIFKWSCAKTDLDVGIRHPLSFIMEVCDDIAYSVLDIEDAVKKELISAADLAAFLGTKKGNDNRVSGLLDQYDSDAKWLESLRMPQGDDVADIPISSKEFRDSLIELFRSYAIGVLVSDGIDKFIELEASHGFESLKKGIAEDFASSGIVSALKEFAKLRIYSHPEVLRAELQGHHVIPRLMTAMWRSVIAEYHGTQSKLDEYVMSLMSPNYLRVYKQSIDLDLPRWYRQVQLVCDQVCGMSDSYALRIHGELVKLGCI